MTINCFAALFTPDAKRELIEILQVAWPLILASLWSYLLSPVALMFCGHLGTTVLDGVSLAGSLINISGISIVTGLSAACDTFFAQTYGSGNFYQLGIYLQRSILIIALSMLPCWAFMINSHAFLMLLAQDEAVSAVAAEYLTKFLFGLPGCFAFILLSKYLQNQDILYPTIIIGAVGNGLNALLHYLFINVWDMGFDGSAYAQAISFDVMGIMSAGYIILWKVYDNEWAGWGRHSLLEWGAFMSLALPSLVMICVESWTIEVGVFLSGLVSIIQQSSQSVLFQIQTITDMLTIGFGSASSIRIGQHLGRGDPKMAKISAILCILVTIAMASVITIVLASLRYVIPLAFTNDQEVIDVVANLLPFLGLYAFADALSATSGGIVRGCGRQLAGSIINIFGYYGIALPVGIPLMLQFSVIDPLWYALCGALIATSVIYLVLIFFTNWEKQAELAAERCNLDNVKEESRAEALIASFAGRRTTWATLSDHPDRAKRRKNTFKSTASITTYQAISRQQSVKAEIKMPVDINESQAVVGGAEENARSRTATGVTESSFQNSIRSAPSIGIEADETTGLLTGTGKYTPHSGHRSSLRDKIRDRLDTPSDTWGLTRRQVAWLLCKRFLAFFICASLLAVSIALRLTIWDYEPILNPNITQFPNNFSTTPVWTQPTTLEYNGTTPGDLN